jgi:hypothetical protein
MGKCLIFTTAEPTYLPTFNIRSSVFSSPSLHPVLLFPNFFGEFLKYQHTHDIGGGLFSAACFQAHKMYF